MSTKLYAPLNFFLTVTFSLVLFSCDKNNEIQPVTKDIKELVFASGELEWDNAYNLTAQTDGVLVNADFEVGNKVVKGSILAKINNETNEINVKTTQEQLRIANENLTSNSPQLLQLQQNIQIAESKYNQDKIQADRYQRLNDNNIGSKVEYENMQLNAKNSLSNWNSLKKQILQIKQQAKQQQIATKGQLENNKVVQNYNQITIVESGTIIKKLKTTGDYIRKGEVIATIADEQKVEAVLHVDENSIGKIKLGQVVFVQLNTNKEAVFNGKISEIQAAFDENTQSFICKVSFDEPLKSTLFGTQLEANVLVGQKRKVDLGIAPRLARFASMRPL